MQEHWEINIDWEIDHKLIFLCIEIDACFCMQNRFV